MVSPGTELIRRMATGDRDALAPFYDLYAPRRPEHRSSRGLNRLLDRGLRGAPKGGLRMSDFVSDVAAIRRRARQHIEKGPVTGGYKADLPRVIAVLNEVLATEIVCVLRYKRHYFTADGLDAQPVAAEFLQHANEEQQHADWVAQRIVQLGGSPNLNPEGLAERSHSQYDEKASLHDMIREDLVAERIAIESYSEIARWLGNDDPTSRVLIENILKMEEEHADDLRTLLATLAPRKRRAGRKPAKG